MWSEGVIRVEAIWWQMAHQHFCGKNGKRQSLVKKNKFLITPKKPKPTAKTSLHAKNLTIVLTFDKMHNLFAFQNPISYKIIKIWYSYYEKKYDACAYVQTQLLRSHQKRLVKLIQISNWLDQYKLHTVTRYKFIHNYVAFGILTE